MRMAEPVESRNFFPALQRNVTPTSTGSTVVSYKSDLGSGPIIALLHGYPQSAFIWRHIAPSLLTKASLFIPELPGYGISTSATTPSAKTTSLALLEALTSTLSLPPSSPRPLLLVGHDRGARISHRLAVTHKSLIPPSLHLIGATLLDIVPTKTQWDNFSNPEMAAHYFHWPLLANVDFATKMILAFGGDNWARIANTRLTGKTEKARARVESDGAVEVYAEVFAKEEAIRGSCEDYLWGAGEEYREQEANQREGRKVEVPTVVMFSAEGLGAKMDVEREWRGWVKDGVHFEAVAVGDGVGHYLPEEAHDVVLEKVLEVLGRFGME